MVPYSFSEPPSAEASRLRAKQLLEKGSNRFHLSLGFMFCVSSAAAAYVLFLFVFYSCKALFFQNINELAVKLIQWGILLLSILCSTPVFHGYLIMCADTLRYGEANLTSLFVPLSSARCFLSSLLFSSVSALSCLVPLAGIIAGCLFEDKPGYTAAIHAVTLLLTPLWLYASELLRRMCRVHVLMPDTGVVKTVKATSKIGMHHRHAYAGLAFSYIPVMLLSCITLFIYGVYGGFALKNLAETDFIMKIISQSSEKKE